MKSFLDVVSSRISGWVGGFEPVAAAAAATHVPVYNKDVLQDFFPKGEKEEDISAARELVQRQVGGIHMKSFLVTKKKCKHGYAQVHHEARRIA